jgi:hypothetical protein
LLSVRHPDQLPQSVTPALQVFEAKPNSISPFALVVFEQFILRTVGRFSQILVSRFSYNYA